LTFINWLIKLVYMKTKTIGAFQAKTHLSELLQEVAGGQTIIITRRGKPIAQLSPFKAQEEKLSKAEILAGFKQIRNNVKGKVNIKEFIDEGRKY
jgi:prevent-host-death family protein